MDQLSAMMAWEDGSLSEGETVALFQNLVNSGLAWQLQGVYGRQAARMIEAGLIAPASPHPVPIQSAPPHFRPEDDAADYSDEDDLP